MEFDGDKSYKRPGWAWQMPYNAKLGVPRQNEAGEEPALTRLQGQGGFQEHVSEVLCVVSCVCDEIPVFTGMTRSEYGAIL